MHIEYWSACMCTNTLIHVYTYMYVYLSMQMQKYVPIIYLCKFTICHNLTRDLRKKKTKHIFCLIISQNLQWYENYGNNSLFTFFFFPSFCLSWALPRWHFLILYIRPVKFSLCQCRLQNPGLAYPTEGEVILKSKKYLWENFIFTLKKILRMGLCQETTFLMVSRGKSHLGEVTSRVMSLFTL